MSGGDGGTLLLRFHALLAGLTAGDLSRVDAAVLGWLAEYAGGEKLEAWPALKTLEVATGLSRRQVSRSIGRLRQLGYIAVSRPGTRGGVSTRHRLTLKGAADIASRKSAASARSEQAVGGSDSTVTTGSDIAVTTVVTNQVEGGDKTVPEVVTALSPKPPINRASSAGDGVVVDLPSASPPAASTAAEAAGSPGGDRPTAARRPGEVVHGWFWARYPKRVKVAEADRFLSDLLAQGADRAAIEAGVIAFAEDVRKRHLDRRYIAEPLNWLRGERWADDFTRPEPAERKEAARHKAPGKGSGRAQEPRSTRTGTRVAPKPAAALKPARFETPDERDARLADAKARKAKLEVERAEREAELAERDRQRAAQQRAQQEDRQRTQLADAIANRRAVLAKLDAAGVEAASVPRLAAVLLVRKRCVHPDLTHAFEQAVTKALAYDAEKAEPTFMQGFLNLFASDEMTEIVPALIERHHELKRQQEEGRTAAAAAASRGCNVNA